MADEVTAAILGAILGAIITFGFAVFFEQLKSPSLQITKNPYSVAIPNFTITVDGFPAARPFTNTAVVELESWRVAVLNREKALLNEAARNCTAWMVLDGNRERFELSWVGGQASVDINVGDQREVDFCARVPGTGIIIAPTEAGYSDAPRRIGSLGGPVTGTLLITSENAKSASAKFRIEGSVASGTLAVTLA